MSNDLTGQKFTRLTAIEIVGRYEKNADKIWKCICDCGSIRNVLAANLKKGNTKSCGCLHSEVSSKTYKNLNKTHGKTGTKVYDAWGSMFDRCSPNSKNHNTYFDRGIKVCERWKKFENFYADVGEPPGKTFSLDRIDNNKGYEPGNVRWATVLQQANNRTTNKYIMHEGEKLTFAEFSRLTGIDRKKVSRMYKSGLLSKFEEAK